MRTKEQLDTICAVLSIVYHGLIKHTEIRNGEKTFITHEGFKIAITESEKSLLKEYLTDLD